MTERNRTKAQTKKRTNDRSELNRRTDEQMTERNMCKYDALQRLQQQKSFKGAGPFHLMIDGSSKKKKEKEKKSKKTVTVFKINHRWKCL